MNPNNTPYTQPGAELGLAERVRGSKALIPVIAVLTVTVLALAAFLVAGRLEAQSDARLAAQDGEIIESKQDGKAVVKPPVAIARTPVANARPASPVACSNCGTIESVTPVQHAAPTSGLGAVAGGLVGACWATRWVVAQAVPLPRWPVQWAAVTLATPLRKTPARRPLTRCVCA